jgi:hypothetical protein
LEIQEVYHNRLSGRNASVELAYLQIQTLPSGEFVSGHQHQPPV